MWRGPEHLTDLPCVALPPGALPFGDIAQQEMQWGAPRYELNLNRAASPEVKGTGLVSR